jgi:hypothetical protein
MRLRRNRQKQEKPSIVDQWIEVEVIAGITTTKRYPSDEDLSRLILKKGENEGRAVELVYRRLNFVHGVPEEYTWAAQTPEQIKYGGHAIQRLRTEDWLQLSCLEQNGHVQPFEFIMPRPETSGGCECPACLAATARIATTGR